MAAGSNAQAGGALDPRRDLDIAGAVSSNGAVSAYGGSGNLGYSAGASSTDPTGGAVTQATNRTTAVTLNRICGTITTSSASLAAEAAAEFTVNNSKVAIRDVVVVAQQSGSNGGNTVAWVSTVANGSFKIQVANNNAAGGTAETAAILLNFAVIKSVIT
jgi:hypothetical protein